MGSGAGQGTWSGLGNVLTGGWLGQNDQAHKPGTSHRLSCGVASLPPQLPGQCQPAAPTRVGWGTQGTGLEACRGLNGVPGPGQQMRAGSPMTERWICPDAPSLPIVQVQSAGARGRR